MTIHLNWSATCDWGNCDNASICLRLSTEDDAGWVAVCRTHADGADDDELAPALDAERAAAPSASPGREALREALRTIADWNAHTDDCAQITDKRRLCGCGWSEISEYARAALEAPEHVNDDSDCYHGTCECPPVPLWEFRP